jgi:nicotinamide-nucleotide amidase
MRLLGVDGATLAEHGAVSEPVARAMARGARERTGASIGIGVTGIAGPSGGTPEKPVGTVFLHVETPDGSRAQEFALPADRESIRRRATVMALHLVRRTLSTEP